MEVDGLPALIAQIIKPYDCFVGILSELGEYPFEIGKEWGIIQSPFGGVLVIPLFGVQRMSNGEPIPMDLEISRLVGRKEKNSQGRYSDSALGDGGVKAGHEEKGIGMVDKTKTKEERNEKLFEVHERARNNLN